MDHDRNTRLYEEILNDSQMFEKDGLMNTEERNKDPTLAIQNESQQTYENPGRASTQQKEN